MKAISVKSVLVVDDEDLICDTIGQIVKLCGYNPIFASDGTEALKALSKASIDLIISDLRMPNMDGIELFDAVKKIHKKIPFIILTGDPDFESISNFTKKAQEKDITFEYMLKPVSVSPLYAKIKEFVEINERQKLMKENFPAYTEPKQVLIGSTKADDRLINALQNAGYRVTQAETPQSLFKAITAPVALKGRLSLVLLDKDFALQPELLNSLRHRDAFPYNFSIVYAKDSIWNAAIAEVIRFTDEFVAPSFYSESDFHKQLTAVLDRKFDERIKKINYELFKPGVKPNIWGMIGQRASGKTTTIDALVSSLPCTSKLIRHTTRKPREGEVDGEDHYLVDQDYFEKHQDRFFLTFEYQDKNGPYKVGFEKGVIEQNLSAGYDVVLTFVKLQSFFDVKSHYPDMKSILLQADPNTLVERASKRDGSSNSPKEVLHEYNSMAWLKQMVDYALYEPLPNLENNWLLRSYDLSKKVAVLSDIIKKERKVFTSYKAKNVLR